MESLNINGYEYDFVISYAGEDTFFAERLFNELTKSEAKVFYAPNEKAFTWGRNLYEYLSEIYSKKGRYCLLIISENYVRKIWTKHEWRNAQVRALEEANDDYILPIRIDDTDLPGLRSTTVFLEISEGIETIAELAIQKLKLEIEESGVSRQPFIRNSSLTIFEERLGQVLPGKYGLHAFSEPRKIDKILHTILQSPLLCLSDSTSWWHPIWWFRGLANNPVQAFRGLGGSQYLIHGDELYVREIHLYRNQDHLDKSFLYLDCDPLPSKIYTKKEVDQALTRRLKSKLGPFVYEALAYNYEADEYAALTNHDTEMFIINGMSKEMKVDEIRRRFVTRYNLFIAPKESRMNSSGLDSVHEILCDELLREEIGMMEFLERFLRFPPWPVELLPPVN